MEGKFCVGDTKFPLNRRGHFSNHFSLLRRSTLILCHFTKTRTGFRYMVVSDPLFLAQRRKESGQQPILFLYTRKFNCERSVSSTYLNT